MNWLRVYHDHKNMVGKVVQHNIIYEVYFQIALVQILLKVEYTSERIMNYKSYA